MKILPALFAFLLLSASASAEEWTGIESGNPLFAIQYKKDSIEQVSATVKKATTRFVSTSDQPIPVINVYSVVSTIEYYCLQPLEKLISAEFVSASGESLGLQSVEFPVLSEILIDSNSYKLWQSVCAENGKARQ